MVDMVEQRMAVKKQIHCHVTNAIALSIDRK